MKIVLPINKTFDCEWTSLVNVMCDLMVGIFENIGIASGLNIDRIFNYIDRILTVAALKNFMSVLLILK